jgi:hypothetical protein
MAIKSGVLSAVVMTALQKLQRAVGVFYRKNVLTLNTG